MLEHRLAASDREKASAQRERRSGSPYPEFFSVRSVDQAIRLLLEYGQEAKLFAGGLDVVSLMKSRLIHPQALINIKPIEKLRYMAGTAEGLRIGALTRLKEIERAELIRKNAPLLAKAAGLVASPHVRNMATIGGNLCQQTRCWYYRRSPETGLTFQCHRKGNQGVCYAREGENQYHAVMGGGGCVSAFPSDLAVALSAMQAQVKIASAEGGRLAPVDRLYTELGPDLEPGEIITAVYLPEGQAGYRQSFLKFRVRKTIDFAIVSVAASYKLTGQTIEEARIFLGGVSPLPYRAVKSEQALIGGRVTPAAAERAGWEAAAESRPLTQNAYKVQLIKALIKRAILGD